ncbi:hypothetical protein H8959_003758 [Pygathrix nigripes]
MEDEGADEIESDPSGRGGSAWEDVAPVQGREPARVGARPLRLRLPRPRVGAGCGVRGCPAGRLGGRAGAGTHARARTGGGGKRGCRGEEAGPAQRAPGRAEAGAAGRGLTPSAAESAPPAAPRSPPAAWGSAAAVSAHLINKACQAPAPRPSITPAAHPAALRGFCERLRGLCVEWAGPAFTRGLGLTPSRPWMGRERGNQVGSKRGSIHGGTHVATTPPALVLPDLQGRILLRTVVLRAAPAGARAGHGGQRRPVSARGPSRRARDPSREQGTRRRPAQGPREASSPLQLRGRPGERARNLLAQQEPGCSEEEGASLALCLGASLAASAPVAAGVLEASRRDEWGPEGPCATSRLGRCPPSFAPNRCSGPPGPGVNSAAPASPSGTTKNSDWDFPE